MRKMIYLLLVTSVTLTINAYATSMSTSQIIESLRDKDYKVVDAAIKSLGIEQGIKGGFKKYEVLQPWNDKLRKLYILALSWEPSDGYLLLLNDSGKVLSKIRVGYINEVSLRELERTSTADFIVVNSITGHGSSFREDKFRIFTISEQGLNTIWEEISYLDDIYMQNKTIHGKISYRLNPDKQTYDVQYDYTVEDHTFNKKTSEWIVEKAGNYSKIYSIREGKMVLRTPQSSK